MVTGYAPLGGPGDTTKVDGFTLLENPTGNDFSTYLVYFSYHFDYPSLQ